MPLVSVLCRSTNRPELVEALQSVDRQTWPNIEIVLVDALGKGLERHKTLAVQTPVREVCGAAPWNRPAAANIALKEARGELLIFLDEDDWIAPGHIEMLVHSLQNNPDIGVAYSSTQKVTPAGIATGDPFRIAFNPARLRRDNFIPIHSALFRRELLNNGSGFDESLDIFEDWDFWLQLAQQKPFLHVDEITAFYRMGGESNTATEDPATRYAPGNRIALAREKVFAKWLPHWSGSEFNQTLGSLDETPLITKLHDDIREIAVHTQELERSRHLQELEMRQLHHKLNKLNQTVHRRNAELNDARNHIRHLKLDYELLINSFSWKITKPVRFLKRQLLALGAGSVKRRLMQSAQTLPPGAEHIHTYLDIPGAVQNEFSGQLTLQGWACSEHGLEQIEAFVDDAPVLQFGTGISRPDIAEKFPQIGDAFTAGFFQEIPLPNTASGEHTLTLRMRDKAGHERTLTQRFHLLNNQDLYNAWYWRQMPETEQLDDIRKQSQMADKPVHFHLLLLPGERHDALLHTLGSLAEQACGHWTLHVLAPESDRLRDTLRDAGIASADKVRFEADLEHTLQALATQPGWSLFLQSGDTLAPHALWEMHLALQAQDAQLLYSDHDAATLAGHHSSPCFTPQWSPDHLLASDYIGGVFAVHNAVLQQLHALSSESVQNPAWRYAILLQLADIADRVIRLPGMLWSADASSDTAALKSAEAALVQSHLQTRQARVIVHEHGIRQIQWPLATKPKVSIIIPTMGKLELIRPCMESLVKMTAYQPYEVIILDNSRGKNPEGIAWLQEQGFKVIECNEAFNWARLNNTGVRHASGDLLLFLNDDIEIIDEQWLDALASEAVRPDVGAVGALLYYPNGALQHTGVLIVNYGGGGIHLLHKRMPGDSIYRHLHETTREVSANTGACLMLSRDKFERIGGFDEELAVVGNDVDLCLRLLDQGYRNLWTPHAKLIHHESISRKTSVPKEDEKAMWKRWQHRFVAGDAYYNPNLSAEKADFTLNMVLSAGASAPSTDKTTAESSGKKYQPGVNLIGFIRAEMGIGEGARSDAKALNAAGEPFGIINYEAGNPSRMTDLSWQHKEVDTAPFDITLLHINPDHAFQAITELPPEFFEGHYRIGYWAWELPELPEDWVNTFAHFDEIWVPSSFVQDAVAMRSPIPVIRIPHAVEVQVDSTLRRTDFGLPDDAFLFLVMFDTHSMAARKNPYGAISAFKEAFAPDRMDVRLILKVNNPTPDAVRSIRKAIGEHQNILILDRVLSRLEVNALISSTDCYVSLHRSEGFGFGPAEAMALGKAILATNWSGNTDYMRPDNCLPIGYTLVSLEEDYGPYKKGQMWAEPDVQQAAQAMQSLLADRTLALTLGRRARATIEAEFSPLVVGRMMRKRLQAIRAQRARQL
ncbi:MAG: glycosyltransferase [Pseudomonadales bacterium]|nr:glycosyltransferase [Pseudomonadales bacterium]